MANRSNPFSVLRKRVEQADIDLGASGLGFGFVSPVKGRFLAARALNARPCGLGLTEAYRRCMVRSYALGMQSAALGCRPDALNLSACAFSGRGSALVCGQLFYWLCVQNRFRNRRSLHAALEVARNFARTGLLVVVLGVSAVRIKPRGDWVFLDAP